MIRSERSATSPSGSSFPPFSIADDYDDTPAPDTSFNDLTTSVGLSAGL